MRKRSLYVFSLLLLSASLFLSCKNPFDPDPPAQRTRVTLRAINSTVLFPSSDKMILCIHKEEDHDINYSQYTTERAVTFENVKPGKYVAHFGSNFSWGERGIRIEVREDQHTVVTFEGYILTYITIGGIQYPKYAMKAYVN